MNFKINLIVIITYFINLSDGQTVVSGKFEIYLNFSNKSQIPEITKKSLSLSNQISNHDVLNPPLCGIGHLPRITGGEKADPRQFPWTAAIIENKRKMVFCGGSVIRQQFILTAAHCIKNQHNFNPGNITIRLGAHKISPGSIPEPGSRDFAVSKWKFHEQYEDQEYANDIALIKLEKKIEFGHHIKPACLPSKQDNLEQGQKIIVVGWGNTHEEGPQSEALLKVRVKAWSQKMCKDNYAKYPKKIFGSQFCASDLEKDSCQGDSGGPAMVKNAQLHWVVVGVVSYGIVCAHHKFPGVYTRVSQYIDWIENTMKTL